MLSTQEHLTKKHFYIRLEQAIGLSDHAINSKFDTWENDF